MRSHEVRGELPRPGSTGMQKARSRYSLGTPTLVVPKGRPGGRKRGSPGSFVPSVTEPILHTTILVNAAGIARPV